jgi:hypothetical protein
VPVVAGPGNNRHTVGNNFNKRRKGKGTMLTNQKNRFRPTLEHLDTPGVRELRAYIDKALAAAKK